MSDKYPSISPYAYCAWNPVKLIDPDGRKVRASDKQAMTNIIYTLSKAEAKYVKFDKDGNLNVKKLNRCKSNSTNFIALKTLAQSQTEYIFSTETHHKDENNDIDLSNPYSITRGVTLMPGNIEDPSPNDKVYVITSSNLTEEDQVANTAHEGYGHAYLYELKQQGQNVDPNHHYERTCVPVYNEELDCITPTIIRTECNTTLQKQIDSSVQEAKQNYQSWVN